MNVVYVTRCFPPNLGGMEKLSYELSSRAEKSFSMKTIALRKRVLLPFFVFYLFFRLLMELREKNVILHVGDGALSFFGPLFKKIYGSPVLITAHGLDITFPNMLYQKVLSFSLKKFDKIICISEASKKECLKRGASEAQCVIIPIGVERPEQPSSQEKMELIRSMESMQSTNKKIILSVGRLVERKGFSWFVEKVFPNLLKKNNTLIYLIVGRGPMEPLLRKIVDKKRLGGKVFLLGRVDDKLLRLLYSSANVFVMPNIKVENDFEGFGIVAIEAAAAGLPVVASNIEGIGDAIKHNKNGFLAKSGCVKDFSKVILRLIENEKERASFGLQSKKFTLEEYSWDKVIEGYLKAYESVKRKPKKTFEV